MEKFKFSLSVMKPEARQVYVFKIILWSSEDENFMAYLVDHLGVHCYYSGQFFFWFLKYDRSSRSLTFDISTYLHICRSIFFVFSFFAKNENIRTIFCKKKRNIAILPMKKSENCICLTNFLSFFGCKLHYAFLHFLPFLCAVCWKQYGA